MADRVCSDTMSSLSQQPPAPSNPSSIPHPTTPSKCHGASNGPQGGRKHHGNYPGDGQSTPLLPISTAHGQTVPATPSKHHGPSNAIWTMPETPKRRKENILQRLPGIKTNLPANLSLDSIRTCLVNTLQLAFTPDDWQVHLIRQILQGYDSIFCAGTGYGKSLIFEGLAVLGKLVVVISPLKALEHDQVCLALLPMNLFTNFLSQARQAMAKGIEAIVINEDTDKTADLWKRARRTAAMVYISPEMALSESFYKLWKDSRFRNCLTAIIVDEAHCIDEWGDDNFRPRD